MRMFQRCRLTGPLALAAIVTLLNAIKPVLIDDTAYLAFARHIAQHPLDPYGFDIFWYNEPDPAMTVLAPPVLPYWLAIGIRLFGEHIFLLKCWLFLFIWLFAWSLEKLLCRFARGTERAALPLIMLSPAILPTVNLMLDVPALAVGLAALVAFVRATDRQSPGLAIAAGLLAALAIQTKYTMLLLPPILLWYGITHRSIRLGLMAVAVAACGVIGWELVLHARYGQSHFLHHLREHKPDWKQMLDEKFALTAPLAGHLGLLATGFGLFAARAVGVPRRAIAAFATLWILGMALVAVLPYHTAIFVQDNRTGREKLTLPAVVWRTAGTATLVVALACSLLLLVRKRTTFRIRWNRDSIFLVSWVLLELGGYYALTPFPAARRVIGWSVAFALLAARTVSRVNRARPDRQPPQWIVPLGVTVGLLVSALVTFDALPEKLLAERAAESVKAHSPHGTVWYAGHWGFQYYCERNGMRPAIDGKTIAEPGDILVWPLIPDPEGFYRPNNINVPPPPPSGVAELLEVFVWEDGLSAQTIPNFYGGQDPIVGRDHPRLKLGVYRVTRPWLVGDSRALDDRPPAADLIRGRFPGLE
jgi:hypothetical protein